jgi:DNA polymerase II small subunit
VQLQVEKEIVKYVSGKNAFIDEKAVSLLTGKDNFREIVDELLSENVLFINQESVEKKLLRTKLDEVGTKNIIVQNKLFRPKAKEAEARLRLITKRDVTGQSKSEGTTKDFLGYFRRKFHLLEQMLKRRQGINPRPISKLKLTQKGKPVDIIGMVFRKWVTKNGHIALQLEDLEGQCIALILKDEANLKTLAERIMVDGVIAVKAVKWNQDIIIVKEVFWPDIPIRQSKLVESELYIASTSDLHIGSKLFLEKEFNSFLNWLNGRQGSEKEREKAGRIKYLVISGDVCDGVGIYPSQFNELAIKDIYEQYKEFSRLIMQIPEYIEILICPGQHDAVRWADPQPAIPKEYVKELYERDNVYFVGSPSWVEIEGLKTLIYHGGALHDLIGSVGFLNSEHPEKAMIEALKKRDIMSTYGKKQPYVPEKEDYMVVREEPDLVYIGDMHHNAYGNYRGTTVINSGTWQARTDYQVKLGHVPTPGIVPLYEMATGKISERHFIQKGENE